MILNSWLTTVSNRIRNASARRRLRRKFKGNRFTQQASPNVRQAPAAFSRLSSAIRKQVWQTFDASPRWTSDSRRFQRQAWQTHDVAPSTEKLEDRTLLAVFNVTTTADVINGGDGVLSLREAVIAANAAAGADTINLTPGLYQLTITGAAENASATGDLDITQQTTIQSTVVGTNAIIDGGGIDRVFHKVSGLHGGSGSLTLNDLTIQNGSTSSDDDLPGFGGGGISHMEGDLTLNRVIVRDNQVISDSTVDGGGLNVDFDDTMDNFTITIVDSTFDNNFSNDRGGAIYLDPDGFTAGGQFTTNIINTTISNNTAVDDAGGIWVNGGDIEQIINITNSTISGNTATTDLGGGLGAFGQWTWNINNSTIVNNSSGAEGGGFSVASGIATVNSTIIANNTAGGPGNDVFGTNGTVTSTVGHNLIEDTTDANLSGTTTGNVTGFDPQLGPLRDNGGPTQTHAPNVGSPAIDAGANPLSLGADQRGYLTRAVGVNADIGAFETDAADPAPNAAPLTAGDIVVLGWSSDSDTDEFAVVPLVDLTAGDVIFFTDRGWDDTNDRFVNFTEEASHFTIAYIVPGGGILAGDVLDDIDLGIDISNFGAGILDTDGDQLLIYQTSGLVAAPTFIYGFNMNLDAANTSGWSTAASPLNTNQTNLPDGATAVATARPPSRRREIRTTPSASPP